MKKKTFSKFLHFFQGMETIIISSLDLQIAFMGEGYD
jgi:hypothetical protein